MEFLTIDGYSVQQHKDELDFIVSKATGKKNYMEIGVYNGGTFNHVSKFVKGKHIAVDLQFQPDCVNNIKRTVKNCYTVEGDTHAYSTLEKIKKILGSETVDVLFIDGDHTYEGVKRDYEMYKQFVTDGGVILFHDVLKSKFHHSLNCYVDKFWDEIPQPKESKIVSDVWGGVGCIVNRKVKYELYQIFFNEESKKKLSPLLNPYNNSKDKSFFFFENGVILDIYKKLDKIDADYVGTCSWKLESKCGLKTVELIERIEATNNNYDVIMFPHQKHIHENVVERNRIFYSPIYQLMSLFDEKNILPFKMLKDKWSCSYCNFWIATKKQYKIYCEKTLIPAMEAFKKDKDIIEFVKNNPFFHNNTKYPIVPFLLEILMGFHVNYYKISHKLINNKGEKELMPDECLCEVINVALVPEGTKQVIFKKSFAKELESFGHVRIIK